MTVSPTARPHLPWNIPQRFWDMYPPTEEIDLPLHVSHNQLSSPLCLISLGVLSNALLSLPSFSSVPPSAPHRFSLSLQEAGPIGMPPIAFTYEIDGCVNLTAFMDEVPIP